LEDKDCNGGGSALPIQPCGVVCIDKLLAIAPADPPEAAKPSDEPVPGDRADAKQLEELPMLPPSCCG